MPLKYTMIVLALAIAALSLHSGGWWLCGLWLAADYLGLALAHACGWHRVFGKRANGALPFWSWIVFGPLQLFSHAVWHAICMLSREPAHQQIAPAVTVGRRLLAHEVPCAFDNYVDLTSEFAEPSQIRRSAAYLSLPILDGTAPEPQVLHAAIEQLHSGTTFIHCAQGHGRTGLFCAALMLERGMANSVDEALDWLRSVRPGMKLSKPQRECLDEFVALLSTKRCLQ